MAWAVLGGGGGVGGGQVLQWHFDNLPWWERVWGSLFKR